MDAFQHPNQTHFAIEEAQGAPGRRRQRSIPRDEAPVLSLVARRAGEWREARRGGVGRSGGDGRVARGGWRRHGEKKRREEERREMRRRDVKEARI